MPKIMNRLVLPKSFYETEQKPSEDFLRGLRNIDPMLLCYWNRFRGRWVIDRYSCANDGHEHKLVCPRMNVLIVETAEHEFQTLNERVYERLHEMDTWAKARSGDELNEQMLVEREAGKAAIDKSIRSDVRHIILDNKEQFRKIQTAIQTHDLRPNDISRANLGNDADLGAAVIGQRSLGERKHG